MSHPLLKKTAGAQATERRECIELYDSLNALKKPQGIDSIMLCTMKNCVTQAIKNQN